jgi:uncharacterized protein YndB with AHSA1/START domain
MTQRPGSATVTLPNDTDIVIPRMFEAPRSLVWQTLTEARHILRRRVYRWGEKLASTRPPDD